MSSGLALELKQGVALNMSETVIGHIDVVTQERIAGWVARVMPDGSREGLRRIAVTSSGKTVAEMVANVSRPDVDSADQGRFGFSLPLTDRMREAFGGGELAVVDLLTGNQLLPDEGQTFPSAWPTRLLDVGDTLIYFSHHANPSGIQRVVVEVYKEARVDNHSGFALVVGNPDGTGFHPLETATWEGVVFALEADPDAVNMLAQDALNEALAQKPLRISKENSLLVLGAPWVGPHYVESVLAAKSAGASVVPLIYDLIPARSRDLFDADLRATFERVMAVYALAADHVLAISEYSRRDFVAWCKEQGLEAPPSSTTRLASNLGLSVSTEIVGGEHTQSSGHVLLVSTIEGRKGHLLALRVWSRLLDSLPFDQVPDLIFVGRPGWHAEEVMETLARTNYLNGKVVVKSRVADAELAHLYRTALFTIYPSKFEGWGLPVGESLALGTPVIASDATSIPEVGGNAACYFPSGDENIFFRLVRQWLTESGELAVWQVRARDYSQDTWSAIAERVIAPLAALESADTSSPWRGPQLAWGEEVLFGRDTEPVRGDNWTHLSWQMQIMHGAPLTGRYARPVDECLGALMLFGRSFAPERYGRWLAIEDPVTLQFRMPNDEAASLYLYVSSGDSSKPALLRVTGDCDPADIWCFGDHLVRLELRMTEQLGTEIKLEGARLSNLDDPRRLGVFLRSAVLVRQGDIPSQLAIMQRQILLLKRDR